MYICNKIINPNSNVLKLKRENTYFQVILKDDCFDFSPNYLLVYVLNEPLSFFMYTIQTNV